MSFEKVDEIARFYECSNAAAYVAEVLQLKDAKYNAKEAVIVDFITNALNTVKMEHEKTLQFIQICLKMIQFCKEGKDPAEVETAFHDAVLADRAFTPLQIKSISSFMAHAFFQHYKLYNLLFQKTIERQIHELTLKIEAPCSTAPLMTAMTEEEWNETLKISEQQDEITELENELRRFRNDSNSASNEIQKLIQEKQLLEQRLGDSVNEQQRCEAALMDNNVNLQRQERSYIQEIENLKRQLKLQMEERNRVLEQRNSNHALMKTQNYELQQELKKLRVEYESVQSQCVCQIQLSSALDSELRVIKGNAQGVQEEMKRLEELMKSYYDRVQDSFVNGEALVNKVKELKERDQIQEQDVQNLKQSCEKLEMELERNKKASLVSDRQIQMLQQDLRDAHLRIKEEQDHKNRILQLLHDSEAESAKLEQTIDNQAERILALQQRTGDSIFGDDSTTVKERVIQEKANEDQMILEKTNEDSQMSLEKSNEDNRTIDLANDESCYEETTEGSILDSLLI